MRIYNYLPGEAIPTPDDVFGPIPRISAPSSPNRASAPEIRPPGFSNPVRAPEFTEERDLAGLLGVRRAAIPCGG